MPNIELTTKTSGERLDKFLSAHLDQQFSRSQIQDFIRDGFVTVNGSTAKAAQKLKRGDQVTLNLPERESTLQAENIPLNIVYEDSCLAVIDKPAGMTVHPGVHNETGTLVNALLYRYPEIVQMNVVEKRAGIVHRLDKNTSGLIVIARDDFTRRQLLAQFEARTVDKNYLALLERQPTHKNGRIDAPIGSDPDHNKRMMVTPAGDAASTEYRVLQSFDHGYALVKVHLLTGRTHQIRVHMAHLGCPLVGDMLYGAKDTHLNRQFLHAAELRFDHPRTGKRLLFESPLPQDLRDFLDMIR